MVVPFSGGCACGAIRYECSAHPVFSWNCHCRDCQRASGSAFCPVLYVSKATLTITGKSKYYDVRAESGNQVSRGFCPECGSPVFIQAELVPDLQGLWAASLDDPSQFQALVQVWTRSAQPWDCLTPTLQKVEKAPTEKQMQELLTPRAKANHKTFIPYSQSSLLGEANDLIITSESFPIHLFVSVCTHQRGDLLMERPPRSRPEQQRRRPA